MNLDRLKAAKEIYSLWDSWQQEAGQIATVEQSSEAYDDVMVQNLLECLARHFPDRE